MRDRLAQNLPELIAMQNVEDREPGPTELPATSEAPNQPLVWVVSGACLVSIAVAVFIAARTPLVPPVRLLVYGLIGGLVFGRKSGWGSERWLATWPYWSRAMVFGAVVAWASLIGGAIGYAARTGQLPDIQGQPPDAAVPPN
jgi:hypothetical protein